jgi:hypothetical protein
VKYQEGKSKERKEGFVGRCVLEKRDPVINENEK